MINLIFLADLVWALGAVYRALYQIDTARHLMSRDKLEHMPTVREIVFDAGFWWLWLSFDFGRWMRKGLQ